MNTKSFAKKQITRICINQVLVSAVIIAAILIFMNFNSPNLYNLFLKPETTENSAMLKTLYDENKTYVSDFIPKLFYTGFDYTTDGKISSKYYVYYDGEKYVLCKMSKKLSDEVYEDYKLSGFIDKLTNIDRQVIDKIAGDIAKNNDMTRAEAKALFADVKIVTTRSVISIQIFNIVGIAIVLICFFKILEAIYFIIGNYKKHNVYTKLKTGEFSAEAVEKMITEELENKVIFKERGFAITENWVVMPSSFKLVIKTSDDLVWAYKVLTRHYTNGIPSGKTHSVKLCFKDRTDFLILVKNEAKADDISAIIWDKVPKIVVGYSDELLKIFQSNMNTFLQIREDVRKGAEEKIEAEPVLEAEPVSEPVSEEKNN